MRRTLDAIRRLESKKLLTNSAVRAPMVPNALMEAQRRSGRFLLASSGIHGVCRMVRRGRVYGYIPNFLTYRLGGSHHLNAYRSRWMSGGVTDTSHDALAGHCC
jgi:hypothetical protein